MTGESSSIAVKRESRHVDTPSVAVVDSDWISTLPGAVGELARRREVLDGATRCPRVEGILVEHPRWSSVVIRRGDGSLTLVDRDRFMGQMSGQLGYGRALFGRQPVERLVGEPVLTMVESTTLDAAAAAALGRLETRRYDDLLVVFGDGAVGTLAVADLFAALSRVHGHSALHDPLTGLPNRRLLLDRLQHARSRLLRHGGKFAVLFVDLDDFKNGSWSSSRRGWSSAISPALALTSQI